MKEKHAREPVILFIDENDITSTGHFSPKFSLKNMDDFFIVSAISPISENYVRLKSSGFDFNEMEINIKEEKCLWIHLYLRYRNSSLIQKLCRNVGKSLRKAVKFIFFYFMRLKLFRFFNIIELNLTIIPTETTPFQSRKKSPLQQFMVRNPSGLIFKMEKA